MVLSHLATKMCFFLSSCVNSFIGRVPTRTGKTAKPGKMGRHFPVREKSENFEQTGKVREKSGKTTPDTGISGKNYLLFFSDI